MLFLGKAGCFLIPSCTVAQLFLPGLDHSSGLAAIRKAPSSFRGHCDIENLFGMQKVPGSILSISRQKVLSWGLL